VSGQQSTERDIKIILYSIITSYVSTSTEKHDLVNDKFINNSSSGHCSASGGE